MQHLRLCCYGGPRRRHPPDELQGLDAQDSRCRSAPDPDPDHDHDHGKWKRKGENLGMELPAPGVEPPGSAALGSLFSFTCCRKRISSRIRDGGARARAPSRRGGGRGGHYFLCLRAASQDAALPCVPTPWISSRGRCRSRGAAPTASAAPPNLLVGPNKQLQEKESKLLGFMSSLLSSVMKAAASWLSRPPAEGKASSWGSFGIRSHGSWRLPPSMAMAPASGGESKFLNFLGFMWNPLSWGMEAAAIMAIALANQGVSHKASSWGSFGICSHESWRLLPSMAFPPASGGISHCHTPLTFTLNNQSCLLHIDEESKFLNFLGFLWNPLSLVMQAAAAIMAIALANRGMIDMVSAIEEGRA